MSSKGSVLSRASARLSAMRSNPEHLVQASAVLNQVFSAGLFFQCPTHVGHPSSVAIAFLLRVTQHLLYQGEHGMLVKPAGTQMRIFPTGRETFGFL